MNLKERFKHSCAPAKDFTPDNPVMMPNWALQNVRQWLEESRSHINPYASQYSTESQKECVGAFERGWLSCKAMLLSELASSETTGNKENKE